MVAGATGSGRRSAVPSFLVSGLGLGNPAPPGRARAWVVSGAIPAKLPRTLAGRLKGRGAEP